MAITVNPYADRAAAQMAVEQQRQPQTVQQPYNLFAQQKQAGYPGVNTPQAGPRVAGEAGIVHSVPVTEPVAKTAPVQDTGGGQRKITPITNTDELAAAMGYTSPQEEERLRKASVANQRILAVGDALRHIGNIANTVNYAPAQQFNSPVAEEQARYEKGKALRDKANQTYLAYQQQKAAQDAKQKQWEAEQKYKRDKDDRDFKFNAEKYATDFAEKQRQYNQNYELNKKKQETAAEQWKQNYEQKERHHRQSQSVQWYNAKTSRMNAENKSSGGSGKEERRDTRRGYLTKRGATAGEIEATYHQMYEWGKKMKDPRTGKPYIDENALKGQMTYGTYSFGGSSTISQDLKERAVDQMLMDHDDAAVRMHSKYGWEWHEQTPSGKKQTIEGFGGGSTSTGRGKQTISGFGGH